VTETVGGLPVVRVSGSARERGRAVGEALAPAVHRSLDVCRAYFGARGVDSGMLPDLLAPYLVASRVTCPEVLEEIDGLAEGADAPWWEVFAANAFEELEELVEPARADAPDHCSSFAVHRSGRTWLGHDEQWLASEGPNCAVVVAVPDDGPAFASPTIASMLPAVGLNASGAAQAIMSLTANDDRPGVPRVLVSRHALQAVAPDDAVARATTRDRAGGYAHVFAFADAECMTVETSARSHAVVSAGGHTNHYLDDALAADADPPGPGTIGRLDALRADLDRQGALDGPEDVRAVLASHHGEPDHPCRHPVEEEGDETDAVIFAVACDPAERRLWVLGGLPCQASFEEVDLTEAFAS
jgi:isopenicillin-N N-acyltransferase-like protein